MFLFFLAACACAQAAFVPLRKVFNGERKDDENYHTIVFDLDGTLLNTLDDLADSTNYALAQFGFPTRSVEEVRRFVGNGVRKLMERAVTCRYG